MICPICGSKGTTLWAVTQDVEYHTSDEKWSYLKCECSVIFLNQPPEDRLTQIYPPTYYSYRTKRTSFLTKAQAILGRRRLTHLLRRIPASDISVLDVGGGNGEFCNRLRAADPRVKSTTILDINEALIDLHLSSSHTFLLGQLGSRPLPQKFHLVSMMNLIEHVANPSELLRHAGDCLYEGGILLIQTPNVNSLDAKLLRKSNWGGFHAPRHWILFEEHSLVSILRRHKFQIVSVDYVQGAPFWAVGVFSLLSKYRVLPRSALPLVDRKVFMILVSVFALLDTIRAALGFQTSQMIVAAQRVSIS